MPSIDVGFTGVSRGRRWSTEKARTICNPFGCRSEIASWKGQRGLGRCGRAMARRGLGGRKCSKRLDSVGQPPAIWSAFFAGR
ncbi:hypothetical protein TIFTF001_023959 [Ficus carica]|uniref:Uncharacterized protein n=1 Tax=Ficus carica TaxID=3494 RepID=A0AA88AMK8_FICCA|nr:hypothetical protein TIFTF001_023959 [Ficus carica]